MISLAINPSKDGFQIASACKEDGRYKLLSRVRCLNPEPDNYSYAANWMQSVIERELIDTKADLISVKLNTSISTKDAVYAHGMPVGIAALTAHKLNVQFAGHTTQILKSPKRFGLEAGTNTHKWVDEFKDGETYWNANCRNAVLGAFFHLP